MSADNQIREALELMRECGQQAEPEFRGAAVLIAQVEKIVQDSGPVSRIQCRKSLERIALEVVEPRKLVFILRISVKKRIPVSLARTRTSTTRNECAISHNSGETAPVHAAHEILERTRKRIKGLIESADPFESPRFDQCAFRSHRRNHLVARKHTPHALPNFESSLLAQIRFIGRKRKQP